MLNYIWAGLIGISLFFAITQDILDFIQNPYENGKTYSYTISFPDGEQNVKTRAIWIRLSSTDSLLANFKPTAHEITFKTIAALPSQWKKIHELSRKSDSEPLRATVSSFNSESKSIEFTLPKVQLVKMRAIAKAAFDMAEFSVRLAIGLIGTMALWLGLMQIAEKSGLIYIVVKLVEPIMQFLFPNVPKGHPAMGAISLNLAANMLGLGNAATPLGIKAMEELQKINPKSDTATDAMCMFLTMNTASVQLVPPVTLVALLGVGIGEMIFSIFFATIISLAVGIFTVKWFSKRYSEQNKSVIPMEAK